MASRCLPESRCNLSDRVAEAKFPEAMAFLFEPSRYKVAYGGRGSSKSWSAAAALLILAAQSPLRILCAREIQKSIKESVHQLLRDQIVALGLEAQYEVLDTEIRGKNGSLFLFAGLRHNIANIKSKEGVDIVWVEEAQTVSKASWDTLIPTIRKEGSEIWVTFNPELDTDDTYVRFVTTPPTGSVVRKVNWSDNPWFPDVLRQEMLDLKARDIDAYMTVWLGHCKQTLDGAVFANEMRAATSEGRICKVPYDRSKPVHTFWDLGRRDLTSIWFAQIVGFEYRVIDFYENRGFALDHYLKVIQDKPYIYGDDWLPHDAENELLASKLTIAQQMRAIGRKVRITPKIKVSEGINAVRTLFPNTYFDADKCADGLNRIRRYCYEVDPDTGQFSRDPLHDDNSNAADALRYLAVALKEPKRADKPKLVKPVFRSSPQAWMG